MSNCIMFWVTTTAGLKASNQIAAMGGAFLDDGNDTQSSTQLKVFKKLRGDAKLKMFWPILPKFFATSLKGF